MRIFLNGKEVDFRGATVADLIRDYRIEGEDLTVEKNLKLLYREEYEKTLLVEGDAVEVVRFVGGG